MTLKVILIFIFLSCFSVVHADFKKMSGVYWGAFDPLTEAHIEIINKSIINIPLKKLYVVVNNNKYKNYTYSLEERMRRVEEVINRNELNNVVLLWQDESNPQSFAEISLMDSGPLCAIAGYDAYKKWVEQSSLDNRSCYDAICVIPRGNEEPILFDKNAFILKIDAKFKDISSSGVKSSTLFRINNNASIELLDLKSSIK